MSMKKIAVSALAACITVGAVITPQAAAQSGWSWDSVEISYGWQKNKKKKDSSSSTTQPAPTTQAPVTQYGNKTFQSFTDSYGVRSQYHIYAEGVDFSQPVGIVVRLHGDKTYGVIDEFEYVPRDTTNSDLAAVARESNSIVLAPKSPDRSGTWWQNSERNSRWLRELMSKEILAQYPNIDKANMDWVGYSGGSEFLSYELLVNNPEWITDEAVLIAGGGAPYWKFTNKASTRQLNDVELNWVVGERDNGSTSVDGFNAVEAAEEGSAYWSSRGYKNVVLDIVSGHDHYSLDHTAISAQYLLD